MESNGGRKVGCPLLCPAPATGFGESRRRENIEYFTLDDNPQLCLQCTQKYNDLYKNKPAHVSDNDKIVLTCSDQTARIAEIE